MIVVLQDIRHWQLKTHMLEYKWHIISCLVYKKCTDDENVVEYEQRNYTKEG